MSTSLTQSTSTYESTYGERPDPTGLALALPDGRVIPANRIVGIAEVKALLDASGRFKDTYPPESGGIPRQRISGWASRWRTTNFPRALPIGPDGALDRGLLWDAREVEAWPGLSGRWKHEDLNADLPDGRAQDEASGN